MLRWGKISNVARLGATSALYVVMVGATGVASAHLGNKLSKRALTPSDKVPAAESLRPLSRVERAERTKTALNLNAVHSPVRPVVAMDRPDIHPAALAAAMDETESLEVQKSIAHATAATSKITVATLHQKQTCDGNACRVHGWTKTAAPKHKSKTSKIAGGAKTIIAAKTKLPASLAAKISPQLAIKLAAKSLHANSGKRGYLKTRLAETPGEIIRLSLLSRS